MSNAVTGLPGIWIAVRQVHGEPADGAPGPAHWANATPEDASANAPNSIEAKTDRARALWPAALR
jgi:hypothetical protein